VFHYNHMRVHLARLGLRLDERQESIGGKDKILYATLLKFDAVMETPRRTCASICYG